MIRSNSLAIMMSVILITVLTGCAATGNSGVNSNANSSNSSKAGTVKVQSGNISLADYLRRAPGVNVYGSGNNVQVIIQGVNTFKAGTSPLFYIDDTRVGRNYSRVQSMVNMNDVDNIRVVKGVEASSYGVEGANGVIIINTKKNN